MYLLRIGGSQTPKRFLKLLLIAARNQSEFVMPRSQAASPTRSEDSFGDDGEPMVKLTCAVCFRLRNARGRTPALTNLSSLRPGESAVSSRQSLYQCAFARRRKTEVQL